MNNNATQAPLVLIPHRLGANIYVQQLGLAYQKLGCSVVFGTENFVESNLRFDIVHLNWPEEIYRTISFGDLENRVAAFNHGIQHWRDQGAFLAWTVHNLEPHEISDRQTELSAYQHIINHSQLIHHHCQCSISLLKDKFSVPPSVSQVSIPHGHFFAYENSITRTDARQALGIDKDKFVFLHLGAIRGYKNFSFVRTGFLDAPVENKLLLVAGRQDTRSALIERVKRYVDRKYRSEFKFELRLIENNELQVYLNACDAVVLGHAKGLNSGIAVLAMSFGKLVIGPSIGCVTEVLNSGQNLLYEPENLDTFINALADAPKLAANDIAEKNLAAAKSWSWAEVTKAVMKASSKL